MLREALLIPEHTPADMDPNYDGSNRNVQPLNDRIVYYYDRQKDCEYPYKPDSDEMGHWEKVEKKVDRYFYVTGDKPSGLAKSFVISKGEAEDGV